MIYIHVHTVMYACTYTRTCTCSFFILMLPQVKITGYHQTRRQHVQTYHWTASTSIHTRTASSPIGSWSTPVTSSTSRRRTASVSLGRATASVARWSIPRVSTAGDQTSKYDSFTSGSARSTRTSVNVAELWYLVTWVIFHACSCVYHQFIM